MSKPALKPLNVRIPLMRCRWVVVICLTVTRIASAQSWPGECGSGSGVIAGQFVPDSSGIDLSRGVWLRSVRCAARSDTGGKFLLRGLAPGSYSVLFGEAGVRRHFSPVVVKVDGVSPSVLQIRLSPENLVADCLLQRNCASTIAPTDSATRLQLSDMQQLTEIAVRTSIAVSRVEYQRAHYPSILCVSMTDDSSGDVPPPVLAAIQQFIPQARQAHECRYVSARRRLETATGASAWQYAVDSISVGGDRATAFSSYYVGPLRAEGWRCQFIRAGRAWSPVSCRSLWVS